MILDSIENADKYYSLNPRLKVAFEFLKNCNPKLLKEGRNEIQGDEVFVNVMDLDLKPRYEALLEVHHQYLDIQVLVSAGKEEFGWSEAAKVKKSKAPYSAEKDIEFFTDEPQTYYTLREGEFTILMPQDAHAPMLGQGHVRKMIFKVLI